MQHARIVLELELDFDIGHGFGGEAAELLAGVMRDFRAGRYAVPCCVPVYGGPDGDSVGRLVVTLEDQLGDGGQAL